MDLPNRKPTRLQGYDYNQNGANFVTICTYHRAQTLSHIVGQGLAPAQTKLTAYGKIAEQQLLDIEKRYENIKVDKYVIIPNHTHVIFVIENMSAGASPCPTLSDVVCTFKSMTTRLCKQIYPIEKIFQNSFYDHIIRNETDYLEIWQYIDNNPAKWQEDRFYMP